MVIEVHGSCPEPNRKEGHDQELIQLPSKTPKGKGGALK